MSAPIPPVPPAPPKVPAKTFKVLVDGVEYTLPEHYHLEADPKPYPKQLIERIYFQPEELEMKLAILIGASKDTLESPLIPLAKGKHRFHVQGLHDSEYQIVYDTDKRGLFNSKTLLALVEPSNIKLQQVKKGTEHAGTICIYSELIPEGDDGTIITQPPNRTPYQLRRR